MSRAHTVNAAGGASSGGAAAAAGLRVARWLGLAATPTFAIMALLTAAPGGGAMQMQCPAGAMAPLSGMVPMYLLMSAFHSPAWLRLIFGR